jgi:hypothetical protein
VSDFRRQFEIHRFEDLEHRAPKSLVILHSARGTDGRDGDRPFMPREFRSEAGRHKKRSALYKKNKSRRRKANLKARRWEQREDDWRAQQGWYGNDDGDDDGEALANERGADSGDADNSDWSCGKSEDDSDATPTAGVAQTPPDAAPEWHSTVAPVTPTDVENARVEHRPQPEQSSA